MDDTLETISIEIESSSKTASSNIKKLAESLAALQQALDSDSFKKLKDVSDGLKSLSGVGDIKINRSFINGLKDIVSIAESITPASINNIKQFTSALSQLSGVDMQGVRGVLGTARGRSLSSVPLKSSPLDAGMDAGMERKILELPDQAKTEESVTRASNYERLASALRRVASAFRTVATAARHATSSVARFIGQRIGNHISKMTEPIKGLTSKLSGLFGTFKRIAFYRLVRTIIKEITKAFGDGINNVYQWSKALNNVGANNFAKNMDDAATSILYLKNSLGAAVAPILNALIPALNALIDKIVEAINWINQLFAALSGASVWTRAKKKATEYAEAATGAGKASKDALRYLLPFDELNVLPDEKDKGGGSKDPTAAWADAFEDVPLEDKFGWIDKVKEKLTNLFKPFKRAWENEGNNTINAAKSAFESLVGLVSSFGQSFENVWQGGLGQETLEIILQIWQNIFGIITAIAEGIKEAWDYANKGALIIRNLWEAYNSVLGFVRDILSATKEWAEKIDWKPLIDGVEKVTGSFKQFIETVKKPLLFIYQQIILPVAKWVIEKLLPKVGDLIDSVLDFASALNDKLTPALKTLWEDYLKPIVEFIEQKVIDNIDKMKESFEKATKEVETHSGAIGAVMGVFETFKDTCDAVIQAVKDVRDAVKKLTGAFGVENSPEWHGSLCFATKESEKEFSAFETAITIFCKALELPMKVIEKLAELVSHVTENIVTLKETLSGGIDFSKFSLFPAGYDTPDFKTNNTAGDAFARTVKSNVNASAFAASNRIQSASDAEKYIEELLKGRSHASGGFPEDGLFFANHGELVGKFANGRTAVANNDQIVAGIAQGVEEANEPVVSAIMTAASQIIAHMGKNGVSMDDLARNVTKWQNRNARAMGY